MTGTSHSTQHQVYENEDVTAYFVEGTLDVEVALSSLTDYLVGECGLPADDPHVVAVRTWPTEIREDWWFEGEDDPEAEHTYLRRAADFPVDDQVETRRGVSFALPRVLVDPERCPALDEAGHSICSRAKGHPSGHVL